MSWPAWCSAAFLDLGWTYLRPSRRLTSWRVRRHAAKPSVPVAPPVEPLKPADVVPASVRAGCAAVAGCTATEATKPAEPSPVAVGATGCAAGCSCTPLTSAELLEQVIAGRDPQRAVAVTAESPRSASAAVPCGSASRSATSGDLYVLKSSPGAEDVHLVFPNLADQKNRIAADLAVAQPSATWSKPLEGPAGVERYIAIVSTSRGHFRLLDARPRGAFKTFVGDPSPALQRNDTGTTPLLAGQGSVCGGRQLLARLRCGSVRGGKDHCAGKRTRRGFAAVGKRPERETCKRQNAGAGTAADPIKRQIFD